MMISEMMAEALHERRMTQTQMAKELGWTTPQYISSIKRGVAGLPPKRFKRFAKVSGYSIEEIIEAYLNDEKERVLKLAGVKCKSL